MVTTLLIKFITGMIIALIIGTEIRHAKVIDDDNL